MFDPYHKWLGILPKDQPPIHYRLLGLEVYESDFDVIEGAADRAMGYVRQYQSGEHAALAAKLLNEIATARLCLLRPASKAEYDAKLRKQLAVSNSIQDAISPFPIDAEIAELKAPKRLPKSKRKKKKTPSGLLVACGIGAGVCLLAIAFMFNRGGKSTPEIDPVSRDVEQSTSSQATPAQTPKHIESPAPKTLESLARSKPMGMIEAEPDAELAGPPLDLIQGIRLSKDNAIGDWKKDGNALIAGVGAKVYLPAKMPEDYQLKFKVKRIAGFNGLIIGFKMDGRQGMIAFDAYDSTCSGLFLDGRDPNANCTTFPGQIFPLNQSSEITLMIHPAHLKAIVNGQTVVDWHGNTARLFNPHTHGLPNIELPFLDSLATFRIESAVMIPLMSESAPPQVAKLDAWVDVMPLLDTDRDSVKGVWALNKNVLRSPDSFGQFSLPVLVPDEYSLSALVELPPGTKSDGTLGVGVIAANTCCSMVLINPGPAGLERIDGQRWNGNETRIASGVLVPGKPTQIVCTVTRQQIRMEFDGRTLIDWRGDQRRLSTQDDWCISDGRRLFFAASSQFKLREIKIGPPLDPPSLPDHPPMAIGKPVDLLALVDLKRDALQGTWSKEGTTLRAMGDAETSKLVFPCQVPAEYKLTMRVAREGGGKADNGGMLLISPAESLLSQVVIDGYESTWSGLHLDQIWLHNPKNVTTRRIRVLPIDAPQEIILFVRKTGLKLVHGSNAIIDWSGDMRRTFTAAEWATPAGRIAIGSYFSRFRIEKMEVEPLEPSSFPPVAKLGADGSLLSILNPQRDSRQGEWTLGANGLISPAIRSARIRIPTSVPDQYELTATVKRIAGTQELLLGLVVGKNSCTAAIDGGGGTMAGLMQLDGFPFYDAPNLTRRAYTSSLLPPHQSVKIRCLVLSDTVIIICGDKEVLRWHGDSRRFAQSVGYQPSNYSMDDQNHLWLGTMDSEFFINTLNLRPLGDGEAARIRAGFTDVYPTSAQADVPLKTLVEP